MSRRYRAIIIEDELPAQELIEVYLDSFHKKVKVVGKAKTVEAGILLLKKEQPDIVFLDINLGKESGFSILEGYTLARKFKTIFTTAHENFAIKAIKHDAQDYLVKPLDPNEFSEAMENVLKKLDGEFRTPESPLLFKHNLGVSRVTINDVVRCEAESNYTKIYLTNDTEILLSKTLKKIQEMLDSYFFIRVHSKHLINRIHIDTFNLQNSITMKDGVNVPISRSKKNEVIISLKENKL